ncbi:MAG: hypothetical protein AAF490_29940, partial [Chloroflexota bacterium]
HYRPNSYLHKWWARRCGSTFRLILKHLVEEKSKQDYYAPKGLTGKIILDPMMGGGTTLHEAIRLGATVLGADLDPIPVLQARATLSSISLEQLESAFEQFFASLQADLAPLFQTIDPDDQTAVPFWYMLYGLRRVCNCREVVVVDSLTLRQKADGSLITLDPESWQVIDGDRRLGGDNKRPLLVEKSEKECPRCRAPYRELLETPYFERYVPVAIAARHKNGKLFFKGVDAQDVATVERANQLRSGLPFSRADFEVAKGRKSIQLHQRGVFNYLDLFSSRQLLYLQKSLTLLPTLPELEQLNLGLLVSTSLEFNSLLSGYKGKGKRRSGAIRHAFAHHAYAFPYTAVENNPVYFRKASGTLQKLFQARIKNGRLWANAPRERRIDSNTAEFITINGERDMGVEIKAEGKGIKDEENGEWLTVNGKWSTNPQSPIPSPQPFWLHQGTSINLPLGDNLVDAIVTDPPYYDSVQYSDLSTFFRVWLRQLLPEEADWQVDVRESAVDPHKLDRESRYRELMTGIFSECHRVLKEENGRLIFTFHHFNPKAWIALSSALKEANFVLVNRYVVFSENPISVHINNMKSLLHDVVLVLAPKGTITERGWKRPLFVDQTNSEQFCRDCGTITGFVLDQNLNHAEIIKIWQSHLKIK